MADAQSFALLVRLLPTVFLGWLAWAVARSPHQAPGHRALAAFFTLLGLGFLLEFLADFAQPASPGLAVMLRDLSLATGIADPLVLLAFALAFPDPRPALRSPLLWAGAVAAAVVVAYLALAGGAAGAWALPLYVDAAYVASAALLLDAYARERHRFRERQLHFVALGVGFAAFSRSAALFFEQPPPLPDAAATFLASSVAITLALTGTAYLWASRRGGPDGRKRVRPLAGWLLGLLLGFTLAHALILSLDGLGFAVASQYFGLRWLVVGGILGYGILAHQLFDFELRTRQAVLFLASLVVGVVAAFGAAILAHDAGQGLTSARALGVVAGVAATVAAYAVLTGLWRRLRPGAEMPARFRERRLELYQAALEYALPGARWTLAEHLFAETLREVFEISAQEHERVMRQLEAQRPAEPLAPHAPPGPA